LNALTGADVLTEDKLFATLDTRSRTLRVGWAGYGDREVVLTDTVGFIRDLPKDLFSAFRATFEEAADADLLLHVVDASDEAREQQIATTDEVLEELDLSRIPRIVAYNKSDLLQVHEGQLLVRRAAREGDEAVLVSATHRETTRALLALIAQKLAERWTESAKVPSVATEGEPEDEPGAEPDAEEEVTTLDAMLRNAGKRTRSAGRTP
jgi:GTP-binding protein HflX